MSFVAGTRAVATKRLARSRSSARYSFSLEPIALPPLPLSTSALSFMIHISSLVTYKLPLKKVCEQNLSHHPSPHYYYYIYIYIRIFTNNWTMRDGWNNKGQRKIFAPPKSECRRACIVKRLVADNVSSLRRRPIWRRFQQKDSRPTNLSSSRTSCTTISPMVNRERDAWTMRRERERERTLDETRVEEKDGGVARIAERQ